MACSFGCSQLCDSSLFAWVCSIRANPEAREPQGPLPQDGVGASFLPLLAPGRTENEQHQGAAGTDSAEASHCHTHSAGTLHSPMSYPVLQLVSLGTPAAFPPMKSLVNSPECQSHKHNTCLCLVVQGQDNQVLGTYTVPGELIGPHRPLRSQAKCHLFGKPFFYESPPDVTIL